MRFIFGVFVGAALMVGSAYIHDTGMVRAGPKQPFVNWDTVIGMLGGEQYSKLLYPRPQFDFPGPCAARLIEHVQIALRDGVGIE